MDKIDFDEIRNELRRKKEQLEKKLNLTKEQVTFMDEMVRTIWDERIYGFGIVAFNKEGKVIPIIDVENLRMIEW